MDMLIWCWYLFLFLDATMATVSTACYGALGLGRCTEHKLSCTGSLVISITNITFGYREGCPNNGVSSCDVNTACCREETGDCFTPYNQTLLSQLQQTCNGKSTCTLNKNNGLDEASSSCWFGNIRHSYSKIEYRCVTNTPSSTSQPTTEATSLRTTNTTSNTISSNQASTDLTNTQDSSTPTKGSSTTDSTLAAANETDTNVGGIVGGIVGVIIVVAIVGVVIFFIKRRKAVKKTPKNGNVNQNSSNRRYQTDTTPPRTAATPDYYELEANGNNSRPNSARPASGDNYDCIGADNHVKRSTARDNYNHIGINDVTSDDEYNHLKGPNSVNPSVPDSNYNHIGGFSVAEDNYQHIGGNKPRIITDDTYNHIDGHGDTGLDSDDYHHIGGSHEHQVVTDDTYNHIGGDHSEILGDDDYHHIGTGNTQPSITDDEYSHVGGADV